MGDRVNAFYTYSDSIYKIEVAFRDNKDGVFIFDDVRLTRLMKFQAIAYHENGKKFLHSGITSGHLLHHWIDFYQREFLVATMKCMRSG